MDVDIAPGVDFVSRITEAVGSCHVLLVIIGPRWATAASGATLPRIFEPGDFVRLEVESGMRRSDIAVIPVLVGGAKMPDASALPAPLRALTRRNAIELSDTRWRYDVDRLLGALDGLLADTSAGDHAVPPVTPGVVTPQSEPRAPGVVPLVLGTTLLAAVAAGAGRRFADVFRGKPESDFDHILQAVLLQGLTWAIVGAAVAVWLASRLRDRQVGTPLVLGAVVGLLAGAGAAGAYTAAYYLPDPSYLPGTLDKIELATTGATGALIGALIARIWRGRAWAGFAVGLLSGALIQHVLHKVGKSDTRWVNACVEAAVIVGFVTITQALLDAWQATSARGVDERPRAYG
jgi:hypothetical protein